MTATIWVIVIVVALVGVTLGLLAYNAEDPFDSDEDEDEDLAEDESDESSSDSMDSHL